MARLLVTDFDGVICDSVLECLIAADNAWRALHEVGEEEKNLDINTIAPERQKKFRRLRPYLRGAEDFVPIFLAVQRGLEIESQYDFDALRQQLADQLPSYQQAFYTERDFLRQNHRELWLELNPLFKKIGEAFTDLSSYEKVFILTTKRQQDVEDILDHHGIAFPIDHIHAVKSDGKMERLQQIMSSNGAMPSETVYLEDQIDYLISAKPLEVKVFLTEWGYVSEEQHHLAEENRIPVISRERFGRLLQDV